MFANLKFLVYTQRMQSSYRSILRQAYEERARLNPSYSMRAYARDLGVAPSTLSEVLKGKKGLSPQRAAKITRALKLPGWQRSYFQDLVAKTHSRSKAGRQNAKQKIQERSVETNILHLKAEAIKALTSWLDLAVLEATHLKDFQGSDTWLSKKFEVSIERIRQTVERLIKVRLLKINSDGTWEDLSPFFTTTDGVPSESIRLFHKDLLRLLDKQIDQVQTEDRTLKSVVFSLEDKHLVEARSILDGAISKIMALAAQSDEKKDHVMCFNSQLFFLAKGSHEIS